MKAEIKIIIGLVLALLLVAAGFWIYQEGQDDGRDAERAVWIKREGARKAAELALVTRNGHDNAALQTQFNQTNVKVSDKHENEIDKNRRDYSADRARADAAGGLRIPAPVRAQCDRPAAPAKAADAIKPDEEAAATVRLPRATEDDLWAVYAEADALSAQIRAMHEWVVKNGFYGTETADEQPLLDRMIADPNQMPEASHD